MERMSSARNTSLGSTIPPELFERFTHFLSGGDCAIFQDERARYSPRIPLKVTKRELGSCSLVCWMWAKALRRNLFKELEIRSHDDARQLMDHAQCDLWPEGFRISAYIDTLILFQNVHHYSWTHNVTHHSSRFPKLRGNVKLILSIPDARSNDNTPFPNTVHHHLPRTLPPAALNHLVLHKPFFSTFDDLVSLVSSTSLNTLEIQSPSWHDSIYAAERPQKQLRPTRMPLRHLYVNYKSSSEPNCSDSGLNVQNPMWLLVWLLTTARAPRLVRDASGHMPTRIVHASRTDISKLVELVKILWSECRCALCTHSGTGKEHAGVSREVTIHWVCSPEPSVLRDSIATDHTLQLALRGHTLNATLTPFGKLRDLGFDLGDVDSLYSAQHISFPSDISTFFKDLNFNFALLDRTLAEMDLSSMTRCRIDIGCQEMYDDSEDCPLESALRLQLVHLQASGCLKVVVCSKDLIRLGAKVDAELQPAP
ncbi:hypothetical protein PHLGIDRAFT_408733 [Phlebiopsis gigantea 11061_1 CR5-6]|uniref:Uncharacterized protein n=1 Tax=Phlebiopsis gigantea (strain 11061_1 CR5-6) TaxID=745531 RepID=A0A0C3SBA6_PHLG1|nr:hypothetical protein PHLGIDRAFT_408733 [Phlebiopsis gigantea 11061_1 CR5-6]